MLLFFWGGGEKLLKRKICSTRAQISLSYMQLICVKFAIVYVEYNEAMEYD